METAYEIIKRLEKSSDFIVMLKKGILPLSVVDKKVYYEYYLSDLKRCKDKAQALLNTSDEFGVSEMTIRRAIAFMEN